MLPTRLVLPAALLIAAAVIASGMPALASAEPNAVTVAVTMSDFKFKLSKNAVPRGAVTFRAVNKGDAPHDFKIAGKKTPIYAPGKGGSLRVTFGKAGRYPFICAVPGHAALGMKGVLRVT